MSTDAVTFIYEHNLDNIRSSGEYTYTSTDGDTFILKVSDFVSAANLRCCVQERINLRTSLVELRIKHGGAFTAWTPYTPDVVKKQDLLDAINGEPIGAVTPNSNGLMTPELLQQLASLRDYVSKTDVDILWDAIIRINKQLESTASKVHDHTEYATKDWAQVAQQEIDTLNQMLRTLETSMDNYAAHVEDNNRNVGALTVMLDTSEIEAAIAGILAELETIKTFHTTTTDTDETDGSVNLGTVGEGKTLIVVPSKGKYQKYNSGGTHRVHAPIVKECCEVKVLVQCANTEGTIYFDDFSAGPSSIETAKGDTYLLTISKLWSIKTIHVTKL